MQFHWIWPSIYAESTPDVAHSLGEVQAKILCPNPALIHSLFPKARAYTQAQCGFRLKMLLKEGQGSQQEKFLLPHHYWAFPKLMLELWYECCWCEQRTLAFPVWCLYLSPFQAAFPSQYCIPLSSWGYETS